MTSKRAITLIPAVIALITVLGNTVKMLIDNDPETNPDWNMVVSTATVAIGVLFARPIKMTSEQADAK